MTEHFGTRFPQFYLTQPAPCPYLPDRQERKVFTKLAGSAARVLNDSLTHFGFRRSQGIAYRPACEGCNACTSVRVLVDAFEPSRTMRRTLRNNRDLTATLVDSIATADQFVLLRRYLDARHPGGGMSEMSVLDYIAMVEDTSVETHLAEYRLPPDTPEAAADDGRLLAVTLTDVLSDGLSMVYSYYDPSEDARSLGSFLILDHIEQARARRLPYVYLGYLVEGCRKMNYKALYGPLEAYTADGWIPYSPR